MRGPLRGFVFTVLATTLMYLPETIEALGAGHPLHVKLFTSARKFSVNPDILLQWGKQVKDKWVAANTAPSPSDSPVVLLMQKEMSTMREELQLLRRALDSVVALFSSTQRVVPVLPALDSTLAPPSLTAGSTSTLPSAAAAPAASAPTSYDNMMRAPTEVVTSSFAFTDFTTMTVATFLLACFDLKLTSSFIAKEPLVFGKNIVPPRKPDETDKKHDKRVSRAKSRGSNVYDYCFALLSVPQRTTLAKPRPPSMGPNFLQYQRDQRTIAEAIADAAVLRLAEDESNLGINANGTSNSVTAIGARISILREKGAKARPAQPPPAVATASSATVAAFFQPPSAKRARPPPSPAPPQSPTRSAGSGSSASASSLGAALYSRAQKYLGGEKGKETAL